VECGKVVRDRATKLYDLLYPNLFQQTPMSTTADEQSAYDAARDLALATDGIDVLDMEAEIEEQALRSPEAFDESYQYFDMSLSGKLVHRTESAEMREHKDVSTFDVPLPMLAYSHSSFDYLGTPYSFDYTSTPYSCSYESGMESEGARLGRNTSYSTTAYEYDFMASSVETKEEIMASSLPKICAGDGFSSEARAEALQVQLEAKYHSATPSQALQFQLEADYHSATPSQALQFQLEGEFEEAQSMQTQDEFDVEAREEQLLLSVSKTKAMAQALDMKTLHQEQHKSSVMPMNTDSRTYVMSGMRPVRPVVHLANDL